jgi:hypothetical protein
MKKIVLILLVGLFAISISGCTKMEEDIDIEEGAPPESKEQDADRAPNLDDLFGDEIDPVGNPVVGTYTTDAKCIVTLGKDGSYRWEHPDGVFLTGTYKLYEGTPNDQGGFTYESDTGALYTVVVAYDTEDLAQNQVTPSLPISIFVYDVYGNDFRVSDLMNQIAFNAVRN